MPYFEDELIRLGDGWVCGRCKPLFVQKLREGVTPAGEMVYAGFWIRFAARFIDGIILYAAGFIIGVLSSIVSNHPLTYLTLKTPFTLALNIAFVTYFLGNFGATPGKMALGLKVVRPDGEKITYARAFGRFFADLLSSFTLFIGYIIAAFDEEKRALHDRICDTRVVRQS